MADVQLDAAVGLRFRTQNVENFDRDQQKVIKLLASIEDDDGGKARDWRVLPPSGGDGKCPTELVDAIFRFQKHWKEKGRLFVADGVVDQNKNTIKLLNKLAAGAPPEPPPKPVGTFVDFIIRIRAGESRDAMANLDKTKWEEYKKKPNRRPVLISENTDDPKDAKVVGRILEQIAKEGPKAGEQLGAIFINGNSAGGRKAVDLAVELTKKKIRIKFVGVADAALFNDGIMLNKPKGPFRGSKADNKPRWFPGSITADVMHNYFQDDDNEWTKSNNPLNDELFWTAPILRRGEFHGHIQGFTPSDGGEELVVPLSDKKNPHVFAGDEGDRRNGATISRLLLTL